MIDFIVCIFCSSEPAQNNGHRNNDTTIILRPVTKYLSFIVAFDVDLHTIYKFEHKK
jgi:hypothetical protein